MYKLSILLTIALLMLFSCNKKKDNKTSLAAITQDTLAPIQVNIIADLPDSLQPNTIALKSMPRPSRVVVPKQTGGFYSKTNAKGEITKIDLEPPVYIPLGVLQNEKGEPILDNEGKTVIMGDGGRSNFTNFTTDNGLALDFIGCSLMDKTGNLWIGTQGGGVSRYDGKSFQNFTTAQGLANNSVWSIIEDKAGNLWFGTQGGGVSRYDGNSFQNFTATHGLANNVVWSITEDSTGNLWFGTQGGVSRYDGHSFENFTTVQGLVNDFVWSTTEDESGNLWFGTQGGGVSRYDGHSFQNFTTDKGLAGNNVYCISEDKTGNLWFGTQAGVSRWDGKSFQNFTTNQGLTNNIVNSITEDKSGNLWFGTKVGVSQYDGKYFENFTTAQGLTNNFIWSITEDITGNIWFGTQGGGMSRYDGKSFQNFTTNQGLANNVVWSITEDKVGNLWFGTQGGGVSRYDGKSFQNFNTAQGLTNDFVWSITEDKTGNLWFGTQGGGVSRYDGKSFQNFSTVQGLANNNVNCITEDKVGNLWFSTGDGVSRYDGKSFQNFTSDQGLVDNNVWDITEDKTGNLWFGTQGGLSRYDGKSFQNFSTLHGLANNVVYSITEDKTGNLWFCTGEGLSMLHEGEVRELANDKVKNKDIISSTLFKSFKIVDGLPDNFVTNIIQLPDGKMAVGTNLGITLFTLSNDFSELKDIEIYNSNTGYPVKDVNVGQNGMYLDSKGIIWAGTGSDKTALVRFDYSALHKGIGQPTVLIQSVKVRDENISWYNLQTRGLRKNKQDSATALLQEFIAYGKPLAASENDSILNRFGSIQFDSITKFYPTPENLVLPYEHNQISFEFSAIETSRPFLVKYQYMLEGYDKDWSPVTNRSNAGFGNINEGTYIFKLKAQGANGVWSNPINYTFKVLSPWYRTWWAYLIYVLMSLAALLTFIKWRERNLRAEKEKLERTVEERTREVVAEKKEAEKQKTEAEKQRQRSDNLLLNILPEEVAEELKTKGSADAKQFEFVTVMFTDFKNFTKISERLSPTELVAEIHTFFKAFDNITGKHNIEKIKTIGDAYMCAGGLPVANTTNAADVVKAALEIQEFMLHHLQQRKNEDKEVFEIRIGIHTGPVVAGIVGVKKFAYDIWGDTVNVASRMESSGEAGKINISGSTYELVKDKFNCTYRGKIQAKNKGEIDMYFVEGVL